MECEREISSSNSDSSQTTVEEKTHLIAVSENVVVVIDAGSVVVAVRCSIWHPSLHCRHDVETNLRLDSPILVVANLTQK